MNNFLDALISFCLRRKIVVLLGVLFVIGGGIFTSPFDWNIPGVERNPVAVDAIPDIGENQQIVYTPWAGRSPQDVEDQITAPLTSALMGMPGVKTVRSYSMFGFSTIYVIFKEEIDFYWSRSRILEKLNSLPANSLPPEVKPTLGPDATALGQVFWYTLEGRDAQGNSVGGWDLQELRSIQDWTVRYALSAVEGISEVASVGGHIKEYQIDIDPDALRAAQLSLHDVINAVRMSNRDVGARSIEINRVEYLIRGRGFITSIDDIENSVITARNGIPILLGSVATVSAGPALRRGVLDKEGSETVGGVVVAHYGENPLQAIKNIKAKIAEISVGLPSRTLADGTVSKVTIIPFYDRSGLISETLNTLNHALSEEILITIIVVLIMLFNFRSAFMVSLLLPVAVLSCFVAMKVVGVDANIVALSGIAIAIGTMVDMGIVMTENIVKTGEQRGFSLASVRDAATEVASAILTAISTTVISFLPVFALQNAEGKLFRPLAYTKTFALIASALVAIIVIPPLAHLLFGRFHKSKTAQTSTSQRRLLRVAAIAFALLLVCYQLTISWLPLGPEVGTILNLIFVATIIGAVLGFFYFLQRSYVAILSWSIEHKALFLSVPLLILLAGAASWKSLGEEFMPSLNEGSFLYMPSTMNHAAISEVSEVISLQDRAIAAIPEVETAVGKLGRAETPLDPAPLSMIETVINYRPKYLMDSEGRPRLFAYRDEPDLMRSPDGRALKAVDGEEYQIAIRFERDAQGALIEDDDGTPFRLWRAELDPDLNPGRQAWAGIETPDDIWQQITAAAAIPGVTSAPKLQPIETRIVMLQSGMKSPLGIKVQGPDLKTIEKVALQMEPLLKGVEQVSPPTVFADRIVGKPYLEIEIDRVASARYGISVARIQDVIEMAIGGKALTMSIEGRQRYPIRLRYQRERRDSVEEIGNILVHGVGNLSIPLKEVATINYVRGPMVIKGENGFLVGYVLFNRKGSYDEVSTVEACDAALKAAITSGELTIPAGVSYRFAGTYENQVRSAKRLAIIIPVALFLIFIILYLQFNSVVTTLLVFSAVAVAGAGGMILLWGYNQSWLMDQPTNLSVAIWVGFLALFGIATDDGVIMGTYLTQRFEKEQPRTIAAIRSNTIEAGKRRVRPCLMTIATTLLALLPILSSTGRGSDIMIPMAIPTFGGMLIVIISMYVVPVLYCLFKEIKINKEL